MFLLLHAKLYILITELRLSDDQTQTITIFSRRFVLSSEKEIIKIFIVLPDDSRNVE
jgi:hypothetical protein